MASVWVPRERDFDAERAYGRLPFEAASEHPLVPDAKAEEPKVTKEDKKSKKKARKVPELIDDPLSAGDFDPLSAHESLLGSSAAFLDTPLGVTNIKRHTELLSALPDDAPVWESRKAAIVQKYTTNEAIPVPSFVSGVGPKVSTQVDRVKNRLEQLDEEEDDGVVLKLTQKDYTAHIEKRRTELIDAWEADKRVKALKTAIKCAKLLGDTAQVIQFYPTKFVLVSEILDTFGELVFDRLRLRSAITLDDGTTVPLKDNFRAEDVADHSKETCKNWFFKIASIRELLPRIYMEMAIISSYRFIENDCFPKVFERLLRMIRGVGDPLVASFARAYLARKGVLLMRGRNQYLLDGFSDYLYTEKSLMTGEWIDQHTESRRISRVKYLDLFSPALDWHLECLAYRGDQTLLQTLLEKYKGSTNGFVLNSIISAFQPKLIAQNSLQLISFIKEADPSNVDKCILFRTLGVHLVLAAPPSEHTLTILNQVWKEVTEEKDVGKYLEVAEVWITYPLTHLSLREANILMKDILDHVSPEKKYFDFQEHLQSIIQKILAFPGLSFKDIFGMKSFLSFLDLFRGDTQTEVNKALLASFTQSAVSVSEQMTRNTMFAVAKNVHDSINALSFADERRHISQLLCGFLRKMDFGRDLEKHLNFLVEARRAFSDLDPVKSELVKTACTLAVKTINFVHGKLSKETSAFVRACVAFCFITIPSMEDVFERLNLYLLAGQVALLGQSVSQAEALFKSAIVLVTEVPALLAGRDGKAFSTASDLLSFLRQLSSLLVAVPGHPERGAFYLLDPLRKVVKDYEWEPKSTGRVSAYIALLAVLCASLQKKLPYEWAKIESNNVMFGSTASYRESVLEAIAAILKDIEDEFARLSEFADSVAHVAQSEALLELANLAVYAAEPLPAVSDLIHSLVKRAVERRARQADVKITVQLAESLSKRLEKDEYAKLHARLVASLPQA